MQPEMLGIAIARAGGPEVLVKERRPVPVPRAGEVLIAVHAAGVNGHDLHHRQRGEHPLLPGESDLPGLEVAGTVAALGDGVADWKVGDSVCALLRGGGYAQYCIAPAAQCLPIPAGLSMVQAASLPETCFTVWSNVFHDGRLAQGETLLVHGGTSGIGVTAIQLAARLGHQVFATTSSAVKVQRCLELGAARAVNYHDEDFAEVLLDATGGRGVDVILDLAVGDFAPRNLQVLADGGRLCVIAAARGPEAVIDFRLVVRKRLLLTGSTLRPRPPAYKSSIAQALRSRVWPLLAQGLIEPVVDSVFPLIDAADAHRYMETGRHIGKVVLSVTPAQECK